MWGCSFVCLFLFVGSSDGYVTLPLYGTYSEDFFWWCSIAVGKNSSFTVTVDTGSSDLLIPSLNCSSCFGGDRSKYYNETSHTVPCQGSALACSHPCPLSDLCQFQVTYGGALTEYANAVRDVVGFSSLQGVVDFGAVYMVKQQQQERTTLRRSEIRRRGRGKKEFAGQQFPEGLWGVAFAKLSSLGTSALDALTAQANVPNVFSLCLEEVGGKMTLGGAPPLPWHYVNVSVPFFWQIPFKDVLVGGRSLGIPSRVYNHPGIVDSGTPFLTLPTVAFEAFKKRLLSDCGKTRLKGMCSLPSNETIFDGKCFNMTEGEKSAYPTIEITFEGTLVLEITPDMYLMQKLYFCEDPDFVGLAIR